MNPMGPPTPLLSKDRVLAMWTDQNPALVEDLLAFGNSRRACPKPTSRPAWSREPDHEGTQPVPSNGSRDGRDRPADDTGRGVDAPDKRRARPGPRRRVAASQRGRQRCAWSSVLTAVVLAHGRAQRHEGMDALALAVCSRLCAHGHHPRRRWLAEAWVEPLGRPLRARGRSSLPLICRRQRAGLRTLQVIARRRSHRAAVHGAILPPLCRR